MMMATKQTASERYWTARRELEDLARYALENKTIEALNKDLQKAFEQIEKVLLSHADFHQMEYSDMVKDYSIRDQKTYRKIIDERYQELMKSDEAYQEFIDEFFPEYDYAKVDRLLTLRSEIFYELAKKGFDMNKKLEEDLRNVIGGTYDSNKQVINMLVGNESSPTLDRTTIDKILNHPWSGKTFSKSLWGNVANLEKVLTEEMIKAKMQGLGADQVIKTMRARYNNASKQNIERLVRTEYTNFAEEAVGQATLD